MIIIPILMKPLKISHSIRFLGGTIKLASNNPFDKPLIDPGHLKTQFDIFTMREAVKAVQRFVAAPAWSDPSEYIIGPFGTAFSAATTDPLIDTYVRGLASSVFHPVGTASMASKAATTGVVNPDLTVKETEGLRIVDASVFVSNSNVSSHRH